MCACLYLYCCVLDVSHFYPVRVCASRVKRLVPSMCIYIYIYIYYICVCICDQKTAVLYFGDHKPSQKLVYCLFLGFICCQRYHR